MVKAVLTASTPLDDPEAVQRFFTFIAPLIQDQEVSWAYLTLFFVYHFVFSSSFRVVLRRVIRVALVRE